MRVGLLSLVFLLGGLTNGGAADWPQWFGPERDGIWREDGIVATLPAEGPSLLWSQPVGAGYAGPAVADNRVVVFSRTLEDPSSRPEDPFERGEIAGQEHVKCFAADTGEPLWTHTYDSPYTVSYAAGPRCTPVVDDGLVYTLGAEGQLHCLRLDDGEVVWRQDFKASLGVETPVWGFAASPLIEGDQLICLARGEGSTVISLDKKTGEERWRALSAEEPGYCPPIVVEDGEGGQRVLIVWHPEAINGLDPGTGNVLWRIPWKLRSGLSVATPRQEGRRLFFTSFYNGATMLAFEAFEKEPKVVWQTERESERRTEHLNSIMGSPVFVDGHLYGVCSYGQFRCLRAEDGERIWETLKPILGKEERWANVFVTPQGKRYFLFNELGELIIAELSPEGYQEISRAKLIEPNGSDMNRRPIVWSHPAYANQCIYVRNDTEVKCFSLKAAEE